MKNFYEITLSTCFTVLASATMAQGPAITNNCLPQIGDIATIAICENDVVNPGPAGENQTWDMSGLTETEERAFIFVSPELGFCGEQFTDATLCGLDWTNNNSFYKFDSNGLSAVAYTTLVDDTDTMKMIFDDFENFIPMPYSFGDTHTDDFSGTSYLPSLDVPFTGDVSFEADGYGTLILPTGTYTDVVRYRFLREQVSMAQIEIVQTKEQYGWVSASHRFWLLIMETNSTDFSESELVWFDKNPAPVVSSVKENQQLPLAVFPNPAQTNDAIFIEWDQNETADIKVFSISGKQLMAAQVNLQAGDNAINLKGIGASAGLHLIQVITDRGTATTKLVIR